MTRWPVTAMVKRSSIVAGIVLSAVIHGLLLGLILPAARGAPTAAPPPRPATIELALSAPERSPPAETPPPPEPAPLPEPAARPAEPVARPTEHVPAAAAEPVASDPVAPPADVAPPAAAEPKAIPPPPATEAVAAPARRAPDTTADRGPAPRPAPPTAPAPAPRPAGGGDDDGVPPLRIHWKDATELIAVARALGMRLAAVDRRGSIVAAIDVIGSPGLTSWRGLPSGYSNRVRMLSPSLFTSPVGPPGGPEIHEIWVFVPAARDRAMIQAQKEAARRAGVLPADVLSMDGRFVPSAGGSFELEITGVKRRPARRSADG